MTCMRERPAPALGASSQRCAKAAAAKGCFVRGRLSKPSVARAVSRAQSRCCRARSGEGRATDTSLLRSGDRSQVAAGGGRLCVGARGHRSRGRRRRATRMRVFAWIPLPQAAHGTIAAVAHVETTAAGSRRRNRHPDRERAFSENSFAGNLRGRALQSSLSLEDVGTEPSKPSRQKRPGLQLTLTPARERPCGVRAVSHWPAAKSAARSRSRSPRASAPRRGDDAERHRHRSLSAIPLRGRRSTQNRFEEVP